MRKISAGTPQVTETWHLEDPGVTRSRKRRNGITVRYPGVKVRYRVTQKFGNKQIKRLYFSSHISFGLWKRYSAAQHYSIFEIVPLVFVAPAQTWPQISDSFFTAFLKNTFPCMQSYGMMSYVRFLTYTKWRMAASCFEPEELHQWCDRQSWSWNKSAKTQICHRWAWGSCWPSIGVHPLYRLQVYPLMQRNHLAQNPGLKTHRIQLCIICKEMNFETMASNDVSKWGQINTKQ